MPASKPRSSYSEHHGGRVREVRGPLAVSGRVREVRVALASTGSVRKARVAARIFRTISKWQLVVIWVPNRIFEKSDRRGESPAREIRPFAFAPYLYQTRPFRTGLAPFTSIFVNRYAPVLRKTTAIAASTATSRTPLNCQARISEPRSPSTP
jgi:hypothetical protein